MTTHKFWNHILCWTLFIVYEVSIARYMGDDSSLLAFGCFYILSIILFYFNAHIVLSRFWSKKSFSGYIAASVFILLELDIYSYLSVILNNAFKGKTGIQLFVHVDAKIFASAIWRGIYFVALSVAYFAVLRAILAIKETTAAKISELNTQNKNERLEKDIVSLQNAYLQAQINPHFLFNTLNFIYNQAEEGNPDTGKNISLLSEIMQYSLAAGEKDGKVPLLQEINHIKRYIKINLFRFDNTLFLQQDISIGEDAREARIPPLILLTFVENVFKHGDMTDKNFPGTIRVFYADSLLTLFTENKKRRPRKENRKRVGLKNAFMRLKNSYPEENIDFSTIDGDINYTFTLKLKL